MKILLALALALLVAAPALADGSCPCDGMDDFDCDNMCPLAKEANAHRSLGNEATAISAIVQADLAKKIEANLARI